MMDKMGLDMQEVADVNEVIIKTNTKEIIISKPQVTEMKAKDSSIFTVTCEDYEEKELEVPKFKSGDVEIVCMKTGASEEQAINSLTETDGDLARAIMLLQPTR